MESARRKVLVVDDSEIVRTMVCMLLSEHGYEVVAVDSPFAFSQALVDEKPDLVLMDVTMPGLRGDQLVNIAQRSPVHDCPIVWFSDRFDAELARLVKRCGAVGYIKKGDEATLVRDIERFMRR